MARLLILILFLTHWVVHLKCEVYGDRPKIKTSNGDLIIEPGVGKNIYLRTNGPKSRIFAGGINLLNFTVGSGGVRDPPSSEDLDKYLNGPNGILRRLEILEGRNLSISNDLLFNVSMLWRRINRLTRSIESLRTQVNEQARDECQSRACQNGATCLNLATGYYCLCPSNWEGQNCDVDVNECRNFAGTDLGCQNGATCLNRPGTYECLCRSGWFGVHCTRKAKDCSGGDYEMCGHGTCIPVNKDEGITCLCNQGWTTNGTGVACLTDINECESSQGPRCSVNPRVDCINLPGSFRCGQCPPGFQGDGYICSDIDECLTIPNGGCSTSPVVTCHNIIGSRICGPCPPGYQGDGVTCAWRGSCSINRGGCHPSAQCVDNPALGGQIAQCICPVGMDGDGIGLQGCYISIGRNDTRTCVSNPCGNHGQCHLLRGGYTCMCYRGYSGAHCDAAADYCASAPCLNSGSCRRDESSARGFRCECTAQYTGDLCHVPSKSCGGLLHAEEGSIVYPLTNTTYNHNSRCAWIIHTDRDKVINVTFSKFNIEVSPECSYDFLQIHDGRTSASQIIGRFCGDTYPKGGNIISSHNNLYFWFRSDPTVAKDGFALRWTSINPVCGGEIDATSHGHISSPGSPGKYPPNRDCYWHLTTTLGKRIQLHFFELDIESHANCSYDYIAIYDGVQSSDPLLSMYCNSTQPAPIESAGSDLLIHFHSDAYESGNGFQIAFASTAGIPGCGGLFTADRGDIASPSLEGKYVSNLLCEYKIKVGADSRIRLNFKSFDLENYGCIYDYLKVYDGPSSDSGLVGRFCGNTYPKSYTSSSNTLFLIFKSDSSISFEGFRLTYESICQKTILGDSGVIKSPGYPFAYPANYVCDYIIGTTPGKVIQLTFQDFDIEYTSGNCVYDSIEIRDGANINATLLGKYCGVSEHIPPVQTSTHNYMHVRFRTDVSISGTGFYANYTTIDTKCGGIYRETTGLISHPSGEYDYYDNYQSCTWMLIAPEGMHIKLTWNRFDIENMPACNNDYLEVIEIDNVNEYNSMGKYCGKVAPPALTINSNRLMIKFESDLSIRFHGFSVTYMFIDEKSHCGGMYAKDHGYIYSPGWPNRYENNMDCVWTIKAPVGQQIKLNMTNFDIELPIHNRCNGSDYLEIRNGIGATAPLIGTYCGGFKSKFIISTANVLYLHFHSDYYISGNGFKIEWDGTVAGCGGTLTSPTGSISSPNYPGNYYENSECFYRIVVNAGARVHISFKELELEQTVTCTDDFVEIYDGRDENAVSLGRYCEMSPKLNSIETTTNYAFIKFQSDMYANRKGFLLEYATICNNNLTGIHGIIESPGYPDNYPLYLNCLWIINVPKGNKINVTFTYMDIFMNFYTERPQSRLRRSVRTSAYYRDLSSCMLDYLQIKESSDTNFGDKICGTTLPPRISSRTNSLQIKFVTGYLIPHTGFRLEWARYGCGGYYRKSSGDLSLDKSITSNGEIECEWVIESAPGTSVNIIFGDVYMADSQNCTIDAVEIYNGPNARTPLLTKICHRGPSRVQSSSNFMFVRFVKHSSLKDVYFKSYFDSFAVGCGGSIETRSGIIHSNNYPKNYDINSDCVWTLVVPRNHRIELNFIDFDLYSDDTDDCRDFIKIYDGRSILEQNYTQLICPNSHASRIISKGNMMVVQFVTSMHIYDTAKGFKANFTVTCGATIRATYDGIITNDNILNHFDHNCTWTILAPSPEQKISLTITHMSIPKDTDVITNRKCPSSFLKVYDGSDENAPLVEEYCGRKVPPTIVSHGSAITIQLGAYNNGTVTGLFSAHYTALSSACGGRLTSEEGTIASPNYPQSYPVSASCEWILRTSSGNKVYMIFEQFDLDYSENCNEDYLEVRENNGAGRLLGLYCGNELPTNTTVASKLYIKFHSDNKNTGRGFVIHYGFIHGNVISGLERGTITSPLFPYKYEAAGEYTWQILGNDRDTISITVQRLEIPTQGSTCYNNLVIYDGYDAEAPVLDELCGLLYDAKVMQTTSNVAFIKLKLDESISGSIFALNWTKTNKNGVIDSSDKINCGINDTKLISPGETVTFTSPNFPNHYNDDLDCEWIYKAPPGYHLALNFLEIHLEQTQMCLQDFISVYSSDTVGDWKLVKGHICLSDTQVMNASNFMKVNFITDYSLNRKGFKAIIRSVCGASISNSSGVVGPVWPDIQDIHTLRMTCDWTVKVRPGRVIKLHFEHFNITNTNHYCSTYVTLRNGNSVEAPLLGNGKYCSTPNEESVTEIESLSNVIFIRYQYTGPTFQNFKLRYEEKNFECGVTSTLDVEHKWEIISTPNYPSVPAAYSECTWVFTGPPGEILRVDFIDRFDLDNREDCDTEFVEIRDGYSDISPSIGRFCGHKPGTKKTRGNTVHITYISQLEEPRNGFKANVSIDVCGGTIVASRGELLSPGYPHMQKMPYGSACEWRIIGTPGQVLNIIPQDIDLPTMETSCNINITIAETNPENKTLETIQTFCGNEDDEHDMSTIQTSTNEVIVTFYMNKQEDSLPVSLSRGFRFKFNSSRLSCGGVITTPEGYLATPGYPRETTLRYCYWFITVPNKLRRVRLELLDFDLTKHRISFYNDVEIGNAIKTLTYNNAEDQSTRVYESSGNELTIFVSSPLKKLRPHRFKATFSSNEEALCGGSLSGSRGDLNSPDLEESYTCLWTYNNALGSGTDTNAFKSIYVTGRLNSSDSIIRFFESDDDRCGFMESKLTVKSDLKSTSVFTRALCGDIDVSLRIPSTNVEVRAIKSYLRSLFFNLQWKLQPCGGVVHADLNSINIINIPSNYSGAIDCAWIVVVPVGKRIQFKVEGNFRLTCEDEFITITQSLSQYATALENYCRERTQQSPIVIPYRYMLIEYHSKFVNNTDIQLFTKTVTGQCGGKITKFDQYFQSPNYLKSYDPNMECTWEITADRGSRISLQFVERFVIEVKVNCSKDVVIVYDWKDEMYIELARLCGRDLPPTYNSTFNRMKVVLRTDADVNLEGFKAMWIPICGGNFTATDKEQFIYSPGYPTQYLPRLDCTYQISSIKTIYLKFYEFDLEGSYPECKYDNLTVNGESTYDNFEKVYCESEMPSPLVYESFVLIFKTDMYRQKKGFKFSYSTFACGGKVSEPTIISSGLFENYEHNLNCTWVIEAPLNKSVVLEFEYIDIEGHRYCITDSISVYNGLLIDTDKRLAHMCGKINSTTVLRSRGNAMVLQFNTDSSISYKGFKAEVFFSYDEAVGCGGTINLESTSSYTLKSPHIGGSRMYENFLDCHWNIEAPMDYAIKLGFKSFEISPCLGVNQTALSDSACDCDYVEIKDGVNPNSLTIGTYCGNTLPPQLISSHSLLSVRLVTDGEIVGAGFEVLLSVQRNVCGQRLFKLSNNMQRVTSPGYAVGSISRGLHCVYYFDMSSEPYRTMHLLIKHLDLLPGTLDQSQCNRDKLTITSVGSVQNTSVGIDYIMHSSREMPFYSHRDFDEDTLRLPDHFVLCGLNQSLDFYLMGSITVDLQTSPESDSKNYKGFELEVVLGGQCGRNYTELQGRMKTSYGYTPGLALTDCFTLITVPENYTISVYFMSASADSWDESIFLEVYDGNKTDAKRLIRISTNFEDNTPVFSSGRYVLLHQKFSEHERIDFDLNYISTDKGRGCGGKVSNLLGRVSSPLYPAVYRQRGSCEWELETPHGTRVRLHFAAFDLGRACDQNYVRLVDRAGAARATYCDETPADYTSEDNYVKIVFTTTMNNGGTGWLVDFVAIL